MAKKKTIYALSSGAGRAAVSVIRISGQAASRVISGLTGGMPVPRTATRCTLTDPSDGIAIDEALVLWFPGPTSFTGEDVAELQVHGSRAVLDRLFDALIQFQDVRPAEAGEFTRRAFENGKMDLMSVEGLADLISAETEEQRRQAWFHKTGAAGRVFDTWREQLINAQANLEAAIDFSDEEGVEDKAIEVAYGVLRQIKQELDKEILKGNVGERIRDGVRVVLAGATNVGKSSLLNELAQRDAAIVSHIAGTTRDVIEVQMDLAGVPVTLVDTAGLREGSGDEIEDIGMERSAAQVAIADLVVWMEAIDQVRSQDIPATDSETLRVLNKVDLVEPGFEMGRCDAAISIKNKKGVDHFVDLLSERIRSAFVSREPALITRARHRTAIEGCVSHITNALNARGNVLELVAEDTRLAVRDMERLIGRVDVEDVLDVIFKDFCIGK